MAGPGLDTLEFLLQVDLINRFLSEVGKEQWQPLFRNNSQATHRSTIYCALLNGKAAEKAMSHDGWDLHFDCGKPGFSQSWKNGKTKTTYYRFGDSGGVRPLVHRRFFNGAYPEYLELDEEFRHYLDLAEDKKRSLLLTFDASGREIEVVRIRPDEITARFKYLRLFQAATQLHMATYIDSVRYSKITLADVPVDELERVETTTAARWRRNIAKCDFSGAFTTFSRVLAKVITPPPPRKQSGVWPYQDVNVQEPVRFIIGSDNEGNAVEHTSDPEYLANYFCANPSAPLYLTPVYFRREVLAKYFGEPERYEVTDGRLRCLGLWSCHIDNDLKSNVVVFLGDLGRDLPYEEQLHWRQFNVLPEGGISETNFRRSFLAEFAEANAPDLIFRQEYNQMNCEWTKKFGWPLFLAPSSCDSHLLSTVRIPVTNSQSEFDEQVGCVTKLLIDSLNERALSEQAGPFEEHAKGISKLDRFLEKTAFPDRENLVRLLRDMQSLRSSGSAHRKGSAYEKISTKLGIDERQKSDAIRRLFEDSVAGLRALRVHYCADVASHYKGSLQPLKANGDASHLSIKGPPDLNHCAFGTAFAPDKLV